MPAVATHRLAPGTKLRAMSSSPRDRRQQSQRRLEHPENDLFGDADSANLAPPEPRSFEELAQGVDPKVQAERNARSTRQAQLWAAGTVILSVLVAFGLALAFRLVGGERCDSGEGVWLCTRSQQLWWAGLTSIPPIVGAIGCGVIMVHKLKTYVRWRSWMGFFWFLVPHCMGWLLATIMVFVDATS